MEADDTWAVFSEADFNPQTTPSNAGAAAVCGDPWSNETWGDVSDFYPAVKEQANKDILDMAIDVFANDDAIMDDTGEADAVPQVHVAIHEQLSSLYDGADDPETQVIGSIHVRAPEEGVKDSFCMVVKDVSGQLAHFRVETSVCNEITQSIPESKLEEGDRVLRVTYPTESKPERLTVARYRCSDGVHPIPLLVKSKVQVTNEFCRVGIRLRANPTNSLPLTNCTMLVAIPPDINGESVRTSRNGSVWDSMKRVVAWSLDDIGPGELMELQAQFEFVELPLEASATVSSPKFPVLVRCDAKDEQFSGLQLSNTVNDNQFRQVKLKVSRSVRILHRKV